LLSSSSSILEGFEMGEKKFVLRMELQSTRRNQDSVWLIPPRD
jgi:hypothetical protein